MPRAEQGGLASVAFGAAPHPDPLPTSPTGLVGRGRAAPPQNSSGRRTHHIFTLRPRKRARGPLSGVLMDRLWQCRRVRGTRADPGQLLGHGPRTFRGRRISVEPVCKNDISKHLRPDALLALGVDRKEGSGVTLAEVFSGMGKRHPASWTQSPRHMTDGLHPCRRLEPTFHRNVRPASDEVPCRAASQLMG